jgi:hypothetical protein
MASLPQVQLFRDAGRDTPDPGLDITTFNSSLQLAHSKVPVRSLTVLEPPTADPDEHVYPGIWEYIRYKPEAVSRAVRARSRCKHGQT